MSHSKILLLTLGLFAMAACTAPTVPDPEMTEAAGSAESGADTSAYGSGGAGGTELAAEDSYAGELATTIYFDLDSPSFYILIGKWTRMLVLTIRSNRVRNLEFDEKNSRQYWHGQ